MNATYLFQEDKLFQEYDLGDKTIQCGRKPDAFKAWCVGWGGAMDVHNARPLACKAVCVCVAGLCMVVYARQLAWPARRVLTVGRSWFA